MIECVICERGIFHVLAGKFAGASAKIRFSRVKNDKLCFRPAKTWKRNIAIRAYLALTLSEKRFGN